MEFKAPTRVVKQEELYDEFEYGGSTVEELQQRVRHLTKIIRGLNEEVIAEQKLTNEAVDHALDLEEQLCSEKARRMELERELAVLKATHGMPTDTLHMQPSVPTVSLSDRPLLAPSSIPVPMVQAAVQQMVSHGPINSNQFPSTGPIPLNPSFNMFGSNTSFSSTLPCPPPAFLPELYNRYLSQMHSWRTGQSDSVIPFVNQMVPRLPFMNQVVPSPIPPRPMAGFNPPLLSRVVVPPLLSADARMSHNDGTNAPRQRTRVDGAPLVMNVSIQNKKRKQGQESAGPCPNKEEIDE